MKHESKPKPKQPLEPTKREVIDCMKHDSYRRVKRRIKQVRWA